MVEQALLVAEEKPEGDKVFTFNEPFPQRPIRLWGNIKGVITVDADFSYYSSLGNRGNNEDAVSAIKTHNGQLFIVADGLGGQDNGEFASRQAVKTVNNLLCYENVSPGALESALIQANADICTLQKEHPNAQTTIAVLWLCAGYAIAMHIGDSRIYHFRDSHILYQSTDHSMAQLAVITGEIKQEEIRGNRERNRLYRVLGDKQKIKISSSLLNTKKGDRLLICSDGFWESITESRMLHLIQTSDSAESWLHQMRAVVEPFSSDNNTAISIILK